jgi:hypothetical protein
MEDLPMNTSIPGLNSPVKTKAKGSAKVLITSRKDASHHGLFAIALDVNFDPASDEYPTGMINIKTDLSDSLKGSFTATSIELINSLGKHNPTIILEGRCKVQLQEQVPLPKGCKFWLLITDNKSVTDAGTPDIVGFVVINNNGYRVAYGFGPVESGDIEVLPS